jgi:hypothetical protein
MQRFDLQQDLSDRCVGVLAAGYSQVGHHALAFADRLRIKLVPRHLREERREKAIHFCGYRDTALAHIVAKAPFKCIMLVAPAVAWQCGGAECKSMRI